MRLRETWDDKCDKCDRPAVCHTEDGCDLCIDHKEDVCTCMDCRATLGLPTSVFSFEDKIYCLECYKFAKLAGKPEKKKSSNRCECGNLFDGRMYIGPRQVCKACFMKPAKKVVNDAVGSTCDGCKEEEPKLRWTKNCDGVRWLCEKCIKKEKEDADLENASKKPLGGRRFCGCGKKLKGYQEDFCDRCFDKNWDKKWGKIDEDLASFQGKGGQVNADPYEPTTLEEIIIVREYYQPQKKGKFNDRKVAQTGAVVDTTPKKLDINKRLGFTEDSSVTKGDSSLPALKDREPVKADKIHGWFCFVDGKIEFRGKWASIPSIPYDIEDRPSDVKIREYARIWMQGMEKKMRGGASNA